MQRFGGVVIDTAGNAIAQPTITVSNSSSTGLATIYADSARTVLANPFTGNVDSTYEFYAQDGHYDVRATKAGFSLSTVPTLDAVLYDGPSLSVVNIKDYGAKGDGTTDDTNAIAAAITAAAAINGAVYIPPSTSGFKIASGLTVANAVTIFGESMMASKIMFSGTGSAFTFSSAGSGVNLHDFQVSNFPGGVENANAVWAFIVNNTSRLSMDRMRIAWSGTGGSIQVTNLTHSFRIAHSFLSDIKVVGIQGVTGQAANMLTITDNTIEGSSVAAGTLISTGGLGVKISGNTIETGLIGIDIVSGGGIDISGNYFEGLATSAIRATVGVETDGLSIRGNNIIQGTATGVDLSATALLTAVSMNGNRLKGAGGTPLKLGGGFVTSSAFGPDWTDAASYFTGTPALSTIYDSTKNTLTIYDVNGVAHTALTTAGQITSLVGMGKTGTAANNLSGSATFAGASSATVTFGTQEPNASYFLGLGGSTSSAGETFTWSGKSTTGFTVRSTLATSTATVDWVLLR